MESEIKFLRRITNNKIKDYDEWQQNNDINLFVIENKEKLEEVNIYINILLQYELLTDNIKRRKKLIKKLEKEWIQI